MKRSAIAEGAVPSDARCRRTIRSTPTGANGPRVNGTLGFAGTDGYQNANDDKLYAEREST